jgi:hypothetical protein
VDLSKQSYLTAEERQTILRGLAEGKRPAEIRDEVDRRHDRRISIGTVDHYKRSAKWADAIQAERDRMQSELQALPLSQAYVRQQLRADLIEQHRDTASALGAVRGLLLDAAKEAGDMQEEQGNSAVQLTVQLVQQVLNLPQPALRAYVESGELEAESYLPDVAAARKLATLTSPPATAPAPPPATPPAIRHIM